MKRNKILKSFFSFLWYIWEETSCVSEVQMNEQWDTLQMYYILSKWDFASAWHVVSDARPWRDMMPHMHHAFMWGSLVQRLSSQRICGVFWSLSCNLICCLCVILFVERSINCRKLWGKRRKKQKSFQDKIMIILQHLLLLIHLILWSWLALNILQKQEKWTRGSANV